MRHQAELLREASLAKVNSYSPYSNFRVGAAILLKDGTIIKGTNIENASYGLSMCAVAFLLIREGRLMSPVSKAGFDEGSRRQNTTDGRCVCLQCLYG